MFMDVDVQQIVSSILGWCKYCMFIFYKIYFVLYYEPRNVEPIPILAGQQYKLVRSI